MYEYYGVVYRKGKLQDDGHGVGYEGYGTAQEIRAHIQQCSHDKGYEQYRHLRKGL